MNELTSLLAVTHFPPRGGTEKEEQRRDFRKGRRERETERGGKINQVAAAAIFRRAVMCSISLRWYNRDKRAEECRGVRGWGVGGCR